MKLGDLLPVFAATDAASATAERNGRFSEFPDEEPTVKQMSDWLDVNLPVITKTHGEMMRGALPPSPPPGLPPRAAPGQGLGRWPRRQW